MVYVCEGCPKTSTDKMKVCRGCRYSYYCSEACYQQHWSEHKKMCKLRRKNRKVQRKLSSASDKARPQYPRSFGVRCVGCPEQPRTFHRVQDCRCCYEPCEQYSVLPHIEEVYTITWNKGFAKILTIFCSATCRRKYEDWLISKTVDRTLSKERSKVILRKE